MCLELVVGDDTACGGGIEFLYDGQVCGMLHVLPKTRSVLEAGEERVGVPSGAPRDVFAHGEVDGARHLVPQSTDRREEILYLIRRSVFPNGHEHQMINQSPAPLLPVTSEGV